MGREPAAPGFSQRRMMRSRWRLQLRFGDLVRRWNPNELPAAVQFVLMTSKTAKTRTARSTLKKTSGPITLAIDIGGSGLKAMLLNPKGKPVSERQRVETPAVPTPLMVLRGLDKLHEMLPAFDRVSVGFPGVIKHGITYTAANLNPKWINFPLQAELEKRWKRPVRVANDAAVQGYGVIIGDGVELALTLGTGMGGALFTSGRLCPGLELGHHPWKKHTYEDYLGRRGLDKYGKKIWNKYLQEAIVQIEKLFNYDHLYLGGGNTKKIDFTPGKNVKIVSNEAGLLGGVALWREWK
jgi:polyphosphate glucokinase